MGDAGALKDPDRLELDVVGPEVLEEAAALAEEDGDQVGSWWLRMKIGTPS